jgi:hypothetical protein
VEHPSIYAYKRWDDDHEFLMLHNFADIPVFWSTDLNANEYTLLKSNSNENEEVHFVLAPWQTKILKRT